MRHRADPVVAHAFQLAPAAVLALAVALVFAPAPAAARDALPRAQAARVTEAPTIDGRLDEAAWTGAPAQSGFRALVAKGRTPAPPEETTFRVLFDGEALYFGIVLREPQVHNLVAAAEGPDGRIWTDDSIEVLLQPTGRFYYQFGINSRGVLFDARMPVSGDADDKAIAGGALWDGVWDAGVSRGEDEWRVEVRVPLATLDPGPDALPSWRLNVGRTAARRMEYSAWAPVQKGFHDLPLFGYLDGIAVAPERFPLDGAGLEFPPLLLGRNAVQVVLPARREGRFRVLTSLRDWSPGPRPDRTPAAEVAADGGQVSLSVPVPVTRAEALQELVLEIRDAATGAPVLLRSHVFRAPAPFDAFLDWMVLYGSDRQAGVTITLAVAEDSARGTVEVTVRGDGVKPRRLRRAVSRAGMLRESLPLAGLPDGFYTVAVAADLPGAGRFTRELRFYKTSGPFESSS